ncbi:NERD domain-containing protein [Tsuneonella sp. SYSU-LHT278]|uniref:nuclease-related domain-containing DEAD/DEAH box helicase n=1 Tax=Tsuneonella sediminis TaxID=3416089 RepID=UPI003F79939A
MAQMIPHVPSQGTPQSELRVFRKLASELETSGWIVFHSLGLSSSYTGHYGEIDFVVLIPGRGIVCVEVKGGGVTQHGGVWSSRDEKGVTHQLKRSPFSQVQSAMFKLRRAIESRFGKHSMEAQVPTGYVVIFPGVDCPPPSPEYTRRDVIDRQDLDRPIAQLLSECPTLEVSSAKAGAAFSGGAFQNLRKFFRPDFERVLTAGASLRPVEESLRALTEEQYAFLDAADLNSRCILVGPAGSGKTTLAVEYARRLSAEGQSVLLVCFNRGLGRWLAERATDLGPGRVVAGSMHKLLDERIGKTSFAAEFRKNRQHPELFSELYPLYGALAIEELGERFDAVLIDEAQDFRSTTLVALAEAWTRDSENPRIVFFGDYVQQAIYDTPGENLQVAREALTGAFALPLRKNCRNTRRIAVQTSSLSGFRDLKLNHGQPEGEAVETTFYRDRTDQTERLAKVFAKLRDEGISSDDVVVLGKYRLENSGVATLSQESCWRLVDDPNGQRKSTVVYSTIYAFKGLESAVVILVDVNCLDEGEGEALLYVGMSRAKARLYMLIDERCRPAFDRKVLTGLTGLVGS